jgi:arginyl-tRNA synthetase
MGLAAPAAISLERPARREHGDWSTSVALATAKTTGRKPREFAAELVEQLEKQSVAHVTKIEVAGPGFVNFSLADTWLHEVLRQVVADGVDAYARPNLGGGARVNVEYVSANPTGPLHAGHARWASYGDALTRVMRRCGYDVHREFYVNDRGAQMTKYALSLVARKWGLEPPDGFYMGQYVRDWAQELPNDESPLEWGLRKALDYQRTTLARMRVEFDTWSSERAITQRGDVEATLAELRAKGHVFEAEGGEEGKGEGKGLALWLRTTDFGDDKDRVLIKSDGTYTYFTPDIAYHRDKFARGATLIDILGPDHHGYVGRMKAAMQCLGHSPADLEMIVGASDRPTSLRAFREAWLRRRPRREPDRPRPRCTACEG